MRVLLVFCRDFNPLDTTSQASEVQWGLNTAMISTSPALPWCFFHQWKQIHPAHPSWIWIWKQQFNLIDIPIFQVGFSSLITCLPVLTPCPTVVKRENNSDTYTQAEGNEKLM